MSAAHLWILLSLAVTSNTALPCCPGINVLDVSTNKCDDYPQADIRINCNGSYLFMMDPNSDPTDSFTINPTTGNLHFAHDGSKQIENFCVTRKLEDGTIFELDIALVCFPDEDDNANNQYQFSIYSSCLLISSTFLLITLIVYLLVPELRDLQGKCLMSGMLSLCIAYISLAILQIHSANFSNVTCVSQAFFTYFWFLCAFFWLHIVSFNVWKSVIFRHFPLSDGQQLICCCVFGWGVPLIFLFVALATHHLPGDHILRPNFGLSKCWFHGPSESWTYFYGPVAILLFGNIIYFIWTAWHLWKECQGQSAPKLRCLRYKCLLYLKLFLVMGIPWIFELLSQLSDESTGFWIVTDILNCLQGLIIFLILVVFRKKALRGLAKHRLWGFNCPRQWAAGVDEESEGMLAEEEELSQTHIRN